jgi:hypothetical protein
MTPKRRREIIRMIKRGRPVSDSERAAACGCASAVLARNNPGARVATRTRLVSIAWALLEGAGGPAGLIGTPSIFSGDPLYDALSAVPRMAKRVHASCCWR